MNEAYLRTVALLLEITPHVFASGRFAMKGGTALNLFVQDMPRLSVDIDVVYVDHTVERRQAIQEIGAELGAIQKKLARLGVHAELLRTGQDEESKILVRNAHSQVKVEVNHIFRGTVLPVETRELVAAAQDQFETRISVPILAVPELYGSKLVAAMDRQHPRDLFDVFRMYERFGLTVEIVDCFVAYLAGHNRPIHEVLFSRGGDLGGAFNAEFVGMTNIPIALHELGAVRQRLHRELPVALSNDHRRFLLSLAGGEPDWSLMPFPHLQELPAIRWKLLNLEKLRRSSPARFREQTEELQRRFE